MRLTPADLAPRVARMLTDRDIDWSLQLAPETDHHPHDQVVDLAVEAQSYRTLAQQAIHALHDLQRLHDRQQDAAHRTLDEYRALRERVLRDQVPTT